MHDTKIWNAVSFVSRSSNRQAVFEELEQPRTPTDISKKLKIDRGYVSSIIKELSARELVECLSPDEVRNRLFKRTAQGDKVLKTIKESIEAHEK